VTTEDVTLTLAIWLVITAATAAILSSKAIVHAKNKVPTVFAIWNHIGIKAEAGITQSV
jgi:hypothetical protein